jgi:hypothetical protein
LTAQVQGAEASSRNRLADAFLNPHWTSSRPEPGRLTAYQASSSAAARLVRPASGERGQLIRIQNLTQVGKQSHLRAPGLTGKVPEQRRAHVRMKVLIDENLTDQQPQLKPQ